MTKRGVVFHHSPTRAECYPISDVSKKVVLIKAHAGMDSTLLDAINALPCDGIVIEALGQGNLPPATLPGIKALINNNIPVVFVSRCFNGIAQDTYAYEGGGKQLKEMGVIFSNGLNGQKARLKLLILLATTTDRNQIEQAFAI